MCGVRGSQEHQVEPSDTCRSEISALAQLLEFEITRLQSDVARPGWTAWALMSALATLVWVLVGQLERGSPDWAEAAYLFVGLSVAFDVVLALRRLLGGSATGNSRGQLRFRFAETALAPFRLLAVTLGVRAFALWLLLIQSGVVLQRWAAIIVQGYLALEFLRALGATLLSYTKLPVPEPVQWRADPTDRVARTASNTILLCAALLLAVPLVRGTFAPGLPEWRVAGLLVAASELLLIAVRPHRGSPLLASLVTLRRELGLGGGADDVSRRTRIAMEGLAVPDVLHEELSDVLHKLGLLSGVFREAEVLFQSIRALHGKSFRELTDDDAERGEALKERGDKLMKQGDDLSIRLREAEEAFVRRASLVGRFHPDCLDEIEPLLERIQEARVPVQESMSNINAILGGLAAGRPGGDGTGSTDVTQEPN